METILCAMGLPIIDESMVKILEVMRTFPEEASLGSILSYARALGLLLALGVGSYECWMMMLGRRSMDVMKLLRIVILSICISCSSWICQALQQPGYYLEVTTKTMADNMSAEVNAMQLKVVKSEMEYANKLREKLFEAHQAEEASEEAKDEGFWSEVKGAVESVMDKVKTYYKMHLYAIETSITELLSTVIKFLAEVYFQMYFYGLLLAQRIFLSIMTIFAPIEFALSLAPPFRAAWSQWMSKYLSLTLWGFVIYMAVYYINYIMLQCLTADLATYDVLLNGNATMSFGEVGMLGWHGFGTTIMYVVVLFMGGVILKLVPEVASWLIPAGTSSGYGTMAGGRIDQGSAMTVRGVGKAVGAVLK